MTGVDTRPSGAVRRGSCPHEPDRKESGKPEALQGIEECGGGSTTQSLAKVPSSWSSLALFTSDCEGRHCDAVGVRCLGRWCLESDQATALPVQSLPGSGFGRCGCRSQS